MDILDYLILEILADEEPYATSVTRLTSSLGIPSGREARFDVTGRLDRLKHFDFVSSLKDKFWFITKKGVDKVNEKGDR